MPVLVMKFGGTSVATLDRIGVDRFAGVLRNAGAHIFQRRRAEAMRAPGVPLLREIIEPIDWATVKGVRE